LELLLARDRCAGLSAQQQVLNVSLDATDCRQLLSSIIFVAPAQSTSHRNTSVVNGTNSSISCSHRRETEDHLSGFGPFLPPVQRTLREMALESLLRQDQTVHETSSLGIRHVSDRDGTLLESRIERYELLCRSQTRRLGEYKGLSHKHGVDLEGPRTEEEGATSVRRLGGYVYASGRRRIYLVEGGHTGNDARLCNGAR